MDIGLFFEGLILIASLGFLFAVFYAFKLSKETKHEKYWVILATAAFLLAIHQWMTIPWGFHLIGEKLKLTIEQVTAIIGSVLFGYALFGLYSSMKKVKEKLR